MQEPPQITFKHNETYKEAKVEAIAGYYQTNTSKDAEKPPHQKIKIYSSNKSKKSNKSNKSSPSG